VVALDRGSTHPGRTVTRPSSTYAEGARGAPARQAGKVAGRSPARRRRPTSLRIPAPSPTLLHLLLRPGAPFHPFLYHSLVSAPTAYAMSPLSSPKIKVGILGATGAYPVPRRLVAALRPTSPRPPADLASFEVDSAQES